MTAPTCRYCAGAEREESRDRAEARRNRALYDGLRASLRALLGLQKAPGHDDILLAVRRLAGAPVQPSPMMRRTAATYTLAAVEDPGLRREIARAYYDSEPDEDEA